MFQVCEAGVGEGKEERLRKRIGPVLLTGGSLNTKYRWRPLTLERLSALQGRSEKHG